MSSNPLNILFIMTDQMRADCMSGVGHPVVKTPHRMHWPPKGSSLSRRMYGLLFAGPVACVFTRDGIRMRLDLRGTKCRCPVMRRQWDITFQKLDIAPLFAARPIIRLIR